MFSADCCGSTAVGRMCHSQMRCSRGIFPLWLSARNLLACLAALSDEEHRASLETFIQQFVDVMSGDEVLATLRNKPN